jgi:hypothetical protein
MTLSMNKFDRAGNAPSSVATGCRGASSGASALSSAWSLAGYLGRLAHMVPTLAVIAVLRIGLGLVHFVCNPIRAALLVAVTLAGLFWTSPARAQDGMIMSLIQRAIDSPSGSVTYTFGAQEPWVRAMRHQMETSGPVTIAAKVVKRFQQEGCARIHARFLVHEATLTQAGKLEDMVFAINFNTCRDGEPPMESLDLAAIQELTTPGQATPAPRMPRIVPLDDPNASPREPAAPQRPAVAAAAPTKAPTPPAAK